MDRSGWGWCVCVCVWEVGEVGGHVVMGFPARKWMDGWVERGRWVGVSISWPRLGGVRS